MNIISIAVLLLFWAGIWLIKVKDPVTLLDRARFYAGKAAAVTSKGPAAKLSSSRKKSRMSQELAEALSYIRNLVILGRGEKMSVELLMEELSGICDALAPAFNDMARSLHVNDKARASGCLYEAIGESYAKDIGTFLAHWEDIPPKELLSSVDAYRSTLRERRQTELRKKDEIISDLVYFPVVLNSMVVLLNFIYVAYFLEQKEALSIMF